MAKKAPKRARKTNTKAAVKPAPKVYTGPILVLKTTKTGGEPHCNGQGDGHGGTIHTDFRWPREGEVTAPDWNPKPECGGGFHALEFGEGSWNLLREDETPSEEWRVVRVQADDLIRLTDDGNVKVKFRRGEIVYCGNKPGALAMVMCGKEAMERAMLLADPSVQGNSSSSASSGNSSSSASSGYYSRSEQIGKRGIAAAIGHNVRGKAGENGLLILTWWDEPAKRYRACVGEVGIDGIGADTWYEVKAGKLSKVPQ